MATKKKSAKKSSSIAAISPIANFPLANPNGISSAYVNNASVTFSAHDMRIVFSEIVSDGQAHSTAVLEMRANVVMTPSHFKALAAALETTVTAYEAQFGEIMWPPKNA